MTDEKVNQQKKTKTRVRVAIRVRPMVSKQLANNESTCVQFHSKQQIVLGLNKNYKFDRVFDTSSHQSEVYEECIRDLIVGCFGGYNAAVLAYGQTGSGKTYTMGTAMQTITSEMGIIPRVIKQIYEEVAKRKSKSEFRIKASFLEIYNQQIIDLLSNNSMKNMKNKDTPISIKEQKDGSISIVGANQQEVNTSQQMVYLLEKGGYHRTTSSTLMNDASSRSHAIFTINIEQHLIEDLYKAQDKKVKNQVDDGFMTAKFFFVDLAGSQRAKKTGATGSTLREGININLGLLELGNVISALSTIEKKSDQFITYRNSKLTRILQDCLGGNSNTYMIACVSPAQSNLEESLNTLKYASKAMNIKNKPIINRDPQSALIAQFRQKNFELQHENRKLKQLLNEKGIKHEQQTTDETQQKLIKLKQNYISLEKKYQNIQTELKNDKRYINQLQIKIYTTRRDKDMLQLTLEEISKKNPSIDITDFKQENDSQNGQLSLLQKYQREVEDLEIQLKDKDCIFNDLQNSYEELIKNSKKDEQILIKKNTAIYLLAKQNETLKQRQKTADPQNEIVFKKDNNEINESNIESTKQIEEEQQFQGESIIILDEDQELNEQSEQFNKQLKIHEGEIDNVDKYIEEKQKYLQQMTKNQIKLEVELIEEMKGEYHQKITVLEQEKNTLIKQKQQINTQIDKNKFVQKIDYLQVQLKQYRSKVTEQKKMQKIVSTQNNKIQDLAVEIKKFKIQKIELNKQLKYDKQNFNRLKKKRIKQLINANNKTIKLENQVKKLTFDNKKKIQMNKKKQQEVKRAKKINETLKNLVKVPTISRRQTIQKKQQIDQNKDNKQFQHQLKILIMNSIKKMLIQLQHEKFLNKYEDKITDIENQLRLLLNDSSIFKLKLQRLKLMEQSQLNQEDLLQKQQLQMNVHDYQQRISHAEDNLSFCQQKYSGLLAECIDYFDLDTEILYNQNYCKSIDIMRKIFIEVFKTFKNLLNENYQFKNQYEENQLQITTLNLKIEQLREQIINMNSQYNQNLGRIRQDMMTRYYVAMQEQEQNKIPNSKKIEEKQKKNLEKKIVELTKSNRSINHQVEIWRRKCMIVQQKYQNIKGIKNKSIGREQSNNSYKNNKSSGMANKNIQMMEDVNQIIEGLDKLKKGNIDEKIQEKQISQIESNHWDCLGKLDAHNSAILSMATHANILISTSAKSLKIWDLQTSKIISDLSGPHLSGQVKYVMVDPERRLIFTACDKTVTIWDLITLNVEGSLKAHKDEVKTMHIFQDYLFTAGKGSANSGSLLSWDLRNLNPNHPMEQKQKNQDIFTMISNQNTLFYGTRNHSVRRMALPNMEIMTPFQPPHLDTVTGLVTIKNHLISGSKDKNLKLWALNTNSHNTKQTIHASNDYITTLRNDLQLPIFYSGSRDGQIRVGKLNSIQEKIQFIGNIQAHTQSISSICSLEQNQNSIIVTASADKTIKLWQPNKQTLSSMETNNQ